MGNTSSIRVHFPASYVRLPACRWWFLPDCCVLSDLFWGGGGKHYPLLDLTPSLIFTAYIQVLNKRLNDASNFTVTFLKVKFGGPQLKNNMDKSHVFIPKRNVIWAGDGHGTKIYPPWKGKSFDSKVGGWEGDIWFIRRVRLYLTIL